MAQTLVNIRMDEKLKKSMEKTCQELGMTMTTAFTIFAKKMSREKRIPFEVSAPKRDALEALYEKLEAAEKERNEGRMLDGPSVMAELMEG